MRLFERRKVKSPQNNKEDKADVYPVIKSRRYQKKEISHVISVLKKGKEPVHHTLKETEKRVPNKELDG